MMGLGYTIYHLWRPTEHIFFKFNIRDIFPGFILHILLPE